MNGTQLKLIALLSMLVDHIGAILFPEITCLRIIGRLSFPLFCFLIAQGFIHTSSVPKYLLRLMTFAVVSELPFDWAIYGKLFYWEAQNIFFTLSLGLCALWLLQKSLPRFPLAGLAGVGALSAAAELLHLDYGWLGVMTVVLFYICSQNKWMTALSFALLNTGYSIALDYTVQPYAAAALLPIVFYNGERGKYSLKYFFYSFYPLHLLALAALQAFCFS